VRGLFYWVVWFFNTIQTFSPAHFGYYLPKPRNTGVFTKPAPSTALSIIQIRKDSDQVNKPAIWQRPRQISANKSKHSDAEIGRTSVQVLSSSREAGTQEIRQETTTDTQLSFPSEPSEKLNPITSNSLNLDKKAIISAYNESKSEIQKMAEKSGKNPDSLRLTQSERLQSALNKAGKPDCIGKETGGAGLLAMPLIAYLSLTDKCK